MKNDPGTTQIAVYIIPMAAKRDHEFAVFKIKR